MTDCDIGYNNFWLFPILQTFSPEKCEISFGKFSLPIGQSEFQKQYA